MRASAGHRRRLVAIGLVAVLAVAVGVGLWRGLDPGDRLAGILEHRFGRTPWLASAEYSQQLPGFPEHYFGRATVTVDGGADGRGVIYTNTAFGIMLIDHDGHAVRTVDQLNLPSPFGQRPPFAALYAPYDIDGDGRSEVVAVARSQDRSEWRLWVLDVAGQRIKGEAALPVGPDLRRPDGYWDGYYVPVGALPVRGLPHPAALLACDVLFDVDGRGVLAVDPVAGEVLWRFTVAGRPRREEVVVRDLDGDGRSEVVFRAWGPGNLRGELINHTSDDSCRVYVLDDRGDLLWMRALGGPHSWGGLAVADLDGDGRPEIVTTTTDALAEAGRLAVWSPRGELLAEQREPGVRPDLVRTFDDGGGRTRLVVQYADSRLATFAWDGRRLERLAERQLPPGYLLGGILAVRPDVPGEQILVATSERARLLDARLRTLVAVPLEAGLRGMAALDWRAQPDLRYLVLPGATRLWYVLEPRRLLPGWVWPGLAAVGLVLAAAANQGLTTWQRLRRRSGGDETVETDPSILRALRLQLLGALEKGGHEKIGALQSLRRLVWHLDAAVSMAAAQEEPIAATATERWLAAAASFREESLPCLREVVALSRRTAAAPHLTASCADTLDELQALLGAPDLAGRGAADVLEAAERLNREAEVAFQRLRRTVEETFCASLPRAVMRVLDAQAEPLRTAGVTVEIAGGDSADGAPWVHIDPPDLEFILDNLVGNAIRAMADATRRVLRLGWTTARGRVVCAVTDSGWGIAPEDWERIFEPGASDRQYGGLGLVRSRCDLRVYGGALKVQTSQPGRGTTFELRLPLARIEAVERARDDGARILERHEGA